MATIRHKRIQLLQSFTPRLIDPSGEALIVTPTSGTININENAQGQLVAQNTITLSAICTRGSQVINWSTTGGQLSQTTGTSVTLTYSTAPVTDMSDITVTAITSADTKYQPSTLTKTAVINKVVPAQTSVELTLYQRAALAPSVLPSAATYNTSTKTVGGTLNSWQATIPIGTDPVYITKATVQFYNASVNIARPVQGWQVSTKLSENGSSGTSGDSVDIIYQRSLTQPTTPSSGTGVPQGWYSDVSAVPSTPTGGSIWASTGTKIGGSSQYTWQLPIVLTGSNIAELTIFLRQASIPATPQGGQYNFQTKQITAPGSWQSGFPAGTDPVYTQRTTASQGDATATVSLSSWQQPVLTVRNGTNGSDATVTMANLKQTIEANSGTTISIVPGSTLFKTVSAGSGGVFIGGGGIYGKDNYNNTTFAIDGQQGNAQFAGTILLGAESGGIRSGLDFKAGSTLYGQLYYNATASGDIAKGMVLGSTDTTSVSTTTQLIQTNSTGTAALSLTALGQQASLILDSPGTSQVFQQVGSSLSVMQVGGKLTLNSNLSFSDLNILQSNIKIDAATPSTFEVLGTQPILKLTRTQQQPWYIKHEASNLVVSFNNTNNDLVLNSSGDLTARGNVTAYSDKAIKQHIRPISQATGKLKQINGYQYKNLLANKHDCGIIAQEIEKILPELVQVSQTEYKGSKVKTVNYNGVVALLVAANRELIVRIEALEAKLK